MANYYATTRTNYFKVKDHAKFEEWVSTLPEVGSFTRDDLMALEANNGDCCGWPSVRWEDEDDDSGEDGSFSIYEEIAEHLAEGSVAIFFEVGNEKLRYLIGRAVAVHPNGNILSIDLDDIYDLVKKQWGVLPSPAQY